MLHVLFFLLLQVSLGCCSPSLAVLLAAQLSTLLPCTNAPAENETNMRCQHTTGGGMKCFMCFSSCFLEQGKDCCSPSFAVLPMPS
jgi:hypothetical protein